MMAFAWLRGANEPFREAACFRFVKVTLLREVRVNEQMHRGGATGIKRVRRVPEIQVGSLDLAGLQLQA